MKRALILSLIPIGINIVIPLSLLVLVPVLLAGALTDDYEINSSEAYYMELNELNLDLWYEQISQAGVLSDYADTFLYYADEFDIDPVLLISISIHETNWGTDRKVTRNNNPGVYSTANQSPVFSSLEEGIREMAYKLSKLINEEILLTVNDLGSVYAPLDDMNNPHQFNAEWVPSVLEIIDLFGGLTRQYFVQGQLEIAENMAWIVPHTKIITSHFRTQSRPNHNGVDIASGGVRGTPVLSLMDGVVTISTSNGTTFESNYNDWRNGRSYGYGWYVEVDHGNGLKTRYAHLLRQGIPVGTKVKAGQIIGEVGSTGGSTGPHLHFETILNGEFVNPLNFIDVFLND